MNTADASTQPSTYDRQLLLSGAKRDVVLDLWEVERYGIDSYKDADYVSVYGMRPTDWHAKGVRLLGRTVVECTRDQLGDAIGKDVARVAAMAPQPASALVVDLFAGSANTMYWLLRHLPTARGVGFELDAGVFHLTRQNLAALALPIDILSMEYRSGLRTILPAEDQLLILFIAPPWGDALDKIHGLDLRLTKPPIIETVDVLFKAFPQNRLLCAVQLHELVNSTSLAELKQRFDWSTVHVYGLNSPGQNHGILVGSKRWTPRPSLSLNADG